MDQVIHPQCDKIRRYGDRKSAIKCVYVVGLLEKVLTLSINHHHHQEIKFFCTKIHLNLIKSKSRCMFHRMTVEKMEFYVSYPFKFTVNYDNSNQRVSLLEPSSSTWGVLWSCCKAQCWYLHCFLPFMLSMYKVLVMKLNLKPSSMQPNSWG